MNTGGLEKRETTLKVYFVKFGLMFCVALEKRSIYHSKWVAAAIEGAASHIGSSIGL